LRRRTVYEHLRPLRRWCSAQVDLHRQSARRVVKVSPRTAGFAARCGVPSHVGLPRDYGRHEGIEPRVCDSCVS
jgi:hypothetical protein